LGPRVYEFGPFRLDAEKAVLRPGPDAVSLALKALSLLTVLAPRGDSRFDALPARAHAGLEGR
jgi:hypothetical protein